MMEPKGGRKVLDVLIVGGGIGGLYAACCLKKAGLSFKLLEAKQQVGGLIGTLEYKGHKIPQGPRIFLQSRAATLLKLAQDYQIPFRTISHKMARYLLEDGHLEPFGFKKLLKYPRIISLFTSKILPEEESIAEFFSSRVGASFTENIVEPLCAGIWAQDPKLLSMDQLMGDIKKKRFFQKKQKGLVVFPGGLNTLLEEMGKEIVESIITGVNAEHIEVRENIVLRTSQGVFKAKKLFVATSWQEASALLKASGLLKEEVAFRSASVDVVSFYFSTRQERPFGSGYLIAKKWGTKTRGVLFDADFLAYETCDILSCFIQGSDHPVEEAYNELKTVFPHLDNYDRAFHKAYPDSIFSCAKGMGPQLEALEEELHERGIYLSGAYPKVGVADVLDKTAKHCQALTGSYADLFCDKA